MKHARVWWRLLTVVPIALCGIALPGSVHADSAPSAAAAGLGETSERAQITAQRRDIEAAYVAAQAACAQRFVVTACVDAAREERRAALAPLRDREFELDMALRATRAAQRREAIERKQREMQAQQQADAARAAAATAATPTRTPVAPAPLLVRPAPGTAGADPAPPAASTAPAVAPRAARPAEAAAAAERAAQAREREARVRAAQARVQQRLDERAAQGRSSAPLPLPLLPAPPATSAPAGR